MDVLSRTICVQVVGVATSDSRWQPKMPRLPSRPGLSSEAIPVHLLVDCKHFHYTPRHYWHVARVAM